MNSSWSALTVFRSSASCGTTRMRMANITVLVGTRCSMTPSATSPSSSARRRHGRPLSAGRARADIEKVVGIGVRDFDGPVAVGKVRRGEDDRLVLKLEQRAAVDGVVVGRIGHDVVGRRQRLHVADLIDRRGRRELLGFLKRGRVQTHLSLALEHCERKRVDVILDANRVIPFLLGPGVGLANLPAEGDAGAAWAILSWP